jgi:hypothetical protein
MYGHDLACLEGLVRHEARPAAVGMGDDATTMGARVASEHLQVAEL